MELLSPVIWAPSQVNAISQFIKAWQLEQTRGFYILDPVLGDNGRIYVDDKLVTAMRAICCLLLTLSHQSV